MGAFAVPGAISVRDPASVMQNINSKPRNRNPDVAMTAFTGLSCRRCMKISATSDAFTVAIPSAMTTLPEPKSKLAAATVIAVSASSAPSVYMYTRGPGCE